MSFGVSTIKLFVLHIVRGVMRHNTGGRASAISFFVFSSMIPLLVLLIYGASIIVPESQVEQLLNHLLQSYVPQLPSEGTLVQQTIRRLGAVKSDIRIVGVIGFIWSSVGGFVLLQSVVDEIWETHKRRSFVRQYLIGFIMLVILMSLTVLASVFTAITPVFSRFLRGTWLSWLHLAHLAATILLPLVLFLTIYFIYRVLPSHKPRLSSTLVGSLFATFAIYICRYGFVIYTHHLGNYQMVYGALTFVMLLTFWIYISSIILLLGIEVSAAVEGVHRSR